MSELRACWYLVGNKWVGGRFHEWGKVDDGAGPVTIGIVEDDNTSAIHMVRPARVHFGHDPSRR